MFFEKESGTVFNAYVDNNIIYTYFNVPITLSIISRFLI